MTERVCLKGLPVKELEAEILKLGHPAFRARQLFRWINQEKQCDFNEMSDLSKAFRKELSEKCVLPSIEVTETQSSEDGTTKYLVKLADGEKVEAVFIPTKGRNTLCVSTQVGCKMACSFCATGYQKFTRDLKSWEIVDQLIGLTFPAPVTNIVLMGMGEPFDNYEEVEKALKIFQDPSGPQIGKRHITVSTVGVTAKIQQFIDSNLGKLAISLHGTTDEQRSTLMPVNRKYPLEGLLEACRKLNLKRGHRLTFEYVLIEGLNDSPDDARRLAKILRGIPSKVNLLNYNENSFIGYKRPAEEKILHFQSILLEKGYTATYRRSRGRDIAAACGQLHHASKKREERMASRNVV